MKEIQLPVAELKEALPGLSKIISRSRTLPVLQSVRVVRNMEGTVSLQSTDLDSFVTYTARGTQEGGQVEVLVPAEQLTKALKCSAPKENIGIIPQEAHDKVTLRYNIAGNVVEQTISTMPVKEWPELPRIRQPGVQLEAGFGQALKEALECASDDSSRRVLNGACLDVADKKLHYVVGTDGRSLFSANSFCFALEKSVVIPDSKFLTWSDFLDEDPCFLSVEPGQEAKPAKDNQPAQEPVPGWVRLESSRWSFLTREIDGKFPNWKQCVPHMQGKQTEVTLSEDAIKQVLQVLPNLPGAKSINSPVRLHIDNHLVLQGRGQDDESWTSIPIPAVEVKGSAVEIALNRNYVLRALKFGLCKLEVEDSLSPVLFSKGGKRLVVMPIRLEEAPAPAKNSSKQHQPEPEVSFQATNKERTEMPRTAEQTQTQTEAQHNGNGSGVKGLVDHIDRIKETLKDVIRNLSEVADSLKLAEKEKKATDKEIEAIRTKLRQIQSVSI